MIAAPPGLRRLPGAWNNQRQHITGSTLFTSVILTCTHFFISQRSLSRTKQIYLLAVTMASWHIKDRGYWHHDGQWRKPRQNNYAFVWPNDKSRNWWGRLADIATNKGADIFITSNPNRTPTAADGPSRRRWTGFPDLEADPNTRRNDGNSWAGNFPGTGYSRNNRPFYDHQKRRYRRSPCQGMWTDVQRYPGRPKQLTAIEMFPHANNWVPTHPYGGTPYLDPANTQRANGVAHGLYGNGGYWDPVTDGWPDDNDPNQVW